MKNYNLRRLASGLVAATFVTIGLMSGCTKVDTTLGGNFTPQDQSMSIGQKSLYASLEAGENYFETRLYRTDSLQSSNLSYAYMGTMKNDTFGVRTASFFSQYIPGNLLNTDDYEGFGYLPIFDSAMIYLYVDLYGGDTNFVQHYEVFEVIDNSFITESADSVFFPDFDITPYLNSEPAFTFAFPDQDNEVYTNTTSIKMETTTTGEDFIRRLMLIDEDGAHVEDIDDDIYITDEDWVEEFKGIYIRPVDNQLTEGYGESEGAVYAPLLESSGFGFYGRNREPEDPTLIMDTIGMTYLFYYSEAEAGNVSINKVSHDYTYSLIDVSQVGSYDNDDVETTATIMVEAMAGVVTQITLTEDFFAILDTILEEEEAETGEEYTSLFFNQAKLMVYTEMVDNYDSSTINPSVATPWFNYIPERLGLYTDYSNYQKEYDGYDETYSSLLGIADYAYQYESSYTIDYGGYLNRSWGCYVMNISSYVQAVWNSYLEAKADANDVVADIDWDEVSGRKIYIAPIAEDIFGLKYATAQGEASTINGAPMRIELTYTMIR